ncbi:hypothetical protein CWI39_0623p0030 [Hamiltosporidium magnivora]|uniref:Ricin B lectin domain-containing protein n=1 Tax=Hamiltosporidium magnivora TaxID=148818 RepID=A0A4Q9LCW9_9MICR|nr:hypothetical protein CWI39_0623p0030 [Hamiltosporidium magnivora]
MFQIFLILTTYIFARNIVDSFLGKKLNIFFSGMENYFLAENLTDFSNKPFIIQNRLVEDENLVVTNKCELLKNGLEYEIKIGDSKLCSDKENVRKCDSKEVQPWKIQKMTFGFSVSRNDNCITRDETGKIKLSKCDTSKNQILFILKLDDFEKCLEMTGNLNEKPKNVQELAYRRKLAPLIEKGVLKPTETSNTSKNPAVLRKLLDKKFPDKTKNQKSKKVYASLWNNTWGFKIPSLSIGDWTKLFCE